MPAPRDLMRNLAHNRVFLLTRLIALTGSFLASGVIFSMRYGLDYGGWLPDAAGNYPAVALRSPGSLLIAVMVEHVDVALWYCLMFSGALFVLAVAAVIVRAVVTPEVHDAR